MSYEEEQAKLKEQYEGKEDLQLEAPLAFPEVNPEIYKDVEPLLFRGFLHAPVEINGVRFIFKSLNHHEFENLKLMAPTEDTSRKSIDRFHNHFLAHGVYMVDGINALKDRDRMIDEIVEFFEAFDHDVVSKIVRCLSELNRRASRAVTLTEAYAMEVVSRLRWTQFRTLDLTSVAVTGVQGTSHLGLNWAQLTWLAINRYEDIKDQSERDWENAKFIASAMAGKSMTRVHNQDKRRRENERKDRIERRDKVLRFVMLGEPLDSADNNRPVIAAKTVADLTRQMARDLKGEKDMHDRVVDIEEARNREATKQRYQRLVDLQKQQDQEYGDLAVVGGTELISLSPDQVRAFVHRKQQLQFEALNQASAENPDLFDPKTHAHNEKWASAKSAVTEEVPLIPTANRPPGIPFKT